MNKQKSLRALAKDLGVSASYLSQVKHGRRPASKRVAKIVSTLDLRVKQVKQSVKHNPDTSQIQCVKQVVKQNQEVRYRPYRIRTYDQRIKSPLLYRTELTAHD